MKSKKLFLGVQRGKCSSRNRMGLSVKTCREIARPIYQEKQAAGKEKRRTIYGKATPATAFYILGLMHHTWQSSICSQTYNWKLFSKKNLNKFSQRTWQFWCGNDILYWVLFYALAFHMQEIYILDIQKKKSCIHIYCIGKENLHLLLILIKLSFIPKYSRKKIFSK